MMELVVPKGGNHDGGGNPAAAPRETFLRDLRRNELGLGHYIHGQDVGIGQVD